MPSLATLASGPIKCLAVGKPGAGKTGMLISLALEDPEVRLFIANYDRGNIGTLANLIAFDPATKAPRPPAVVERLAGQIQYRNFQDTIKTVNGVTMITGQVDAFKQLGDALNKWDDTHGGMNQWGPKDWFVLDSISAWGESGLRYALSQANRLNKRPEQSDWGDAINRCQLLLEMTNDPAIPCNVLAITHVRFVGDPERGTDAKGNANELDMVPNALGQKLPQEIGRYFNNILEIRVVGNGPGEQRKIFTKSPGGLVLRSSNPAMVKPEYPISNGFAAWVRDVQSLPTATPSATVATAPPPAADSQPTAS